jgi:hypothetical protein
MYLKVEYLRDPAQPASACWSFHPLVEDLDEAASIAREGLADVSDYFGAQGFRILDFAGDVLAQEPLSPPVYS